MKTGTNSGCCTPPADTFLAKLSPVSVMSDPECAVAEPKYETPFFDEVSPNNSLVIPAVGESFYLNVESASRFHPGQWLEIESVGRFPVASVINAKRLVLTNTGYNSTLLPGASFLGSRKIWPVDRPSGNELDETVTLLTAAMSDKTFDFTAYLKVTNEAETGYPIAAISTTAACEPCAKNSGSEDRVHAVRYFKNIVFKWFTISFPLMPKVLGLSKTFKRGGTEVTEPYNRVVIDPQSGDLFSKRPPAAPSVEYHTPNDSAYVAVPGDFATKFYALSANKTNGKPQFRELAFMVPVYIGADLVIGPVDFKALIESATGKELPSTGTIQIALFAKLEAINGHATFDGQTICRTGAGDTYAHCTRVFSLDLASPTKTIAGTYMQLSHAFVPAGVILNG